MNKYGSTWIKNNRDPHGSKININQTGSKINIDPHGSKWVRMDQYKSKINMAPRVSKNMNQRSKGINIVHRSTWIPMD